MTGTSLLKTMIDGEMYTCFICNTEKQFHYHGGDNRLNKLSKDKVYSTAYNGQVVMVCQWCRDHKDCDMIIADKLVPAIV